MVKSRFVNRTFTFKSEEDTHIKMILDDARSKGLSYRECAVEAFKAYATPSNVDHANKYRIVLMQELDADIARLKDERDKAIAEYDALIKAKEEKRTSIVEMFEETFNQTIVDMKARMVSSNVDGSIQQFFEAMYDNGRTCYHLVRFLNKEDTRKDFNAIKGYFTDERWQHLANFFTARGREKTIHDDFDTKIFEEYLMRD